nr:DUF6503 family protein [Allomuricauda sp.]
MKRLIILLAFLILGACKEAPKNQPEPENQENMEAVVEKKFPESLSKVFDTHGGIDQWKKQRTLSYTMERPDYNEIHTIDLHNRKDRIDAGQFSMGFDGQQVWLDDTEENYKGNPGFYHNLMFYFYAMPFVLGDDGILYGHTEDLIFEGKHYPGIQIAYNYGVGASSKDEYYIHYDPDTHQMAWLGYTVTYRSGEKSDDVRWIRYDDWATVEGVVLPKSITWYKYENRDLIEPRNNVPFKDISLSTTKKGDDFYAKPETAKFVELNKS